MAESEQAATVQRTISLPVPIEQAFKHFTEGMGQWWPFANTFSRDNYQQVIVEPETGGRWYEVSTVGEELDWGQVIAWEPPHRLVLTWQITAQGTPEADPAKASEIEVRFHAETPESTEVTLTHSAFERHGSEAGAIWHAGMDSEATGWTYFLRLYSAFVLANQAGKPLNPEPT